MPAEDSALNPTKSENKSERGAARETGEDLPRRFGRLTLLRLLARGGMGEVYLAATGGIEGAERPCVVKIIRREHHEDRSFLARFLDEARIQSQLSHPGVAQIVEAATDESGKPFVVVEHVEGRNLGEVRNRVHQLGARISWPEALAVGVMMAEALAHVHERTDAAGQPLEIVHRDLSPQNVMLGYGGDLKLIDFGTARGENRRCHTVAGIVFAKPGYVAPEVANNTPGGIPADLYAFGIMLWELLAGRRFLSGEASEHMAAVGAGVRNPTPIAQLCDAPPELDAVIAKLTATRIEDRYPSAREALSDIIELMKRAPSLPNGERGIRARVAQLMQRMYPAEPARSRAEFSRLVALARKAQKPRVILPPPSPEPPPTEGDPSVLSGTRYRMLREIGHGSMGRVHEACHIDLGRQVALKVLSGDSSSVASSDQLRAEARAIARIEHENLVKLFDFGFSADGRAFYAMEYLEGEALDRRLGRGDEVPWREAARIGVQACRALEAAHTAGVTHRDIKPANLFLTAGGTVKLLDFGVAKSTRDVEPQEGDGEAFVIVGTPEYMAPEQARGGEADERSDIYALGSVLYELVTGRLPFEATSTIALLDTKARNRPEAAGRRAPQRGIPAMLEKTIQTAVDPNPENRFQSAEEMREALEAALREPEQKRRRRRRIGFAFVGAMFVAIAGIGGFTAVKPDVRAKAWAAAQPMIQKLRGTPPAEVAASTVAEEPGVGGSEETASEPSEATEESAEPSAEVAAAEPAAEEATGEPSEESSAEETTSETAKAEPAAEEATDEQAEPEAKPAEPEKTAAQDEMFSAQPVKEASGDKLEAELAKAAEMMQNGKKIKAFNEYRRIGKNNRKDPRALKAWSEVAAQMKGYGEALRVAKQWASVEKSVESRMHLASMQRKVGKREDAIKTLNALLQERPGLGEARALLQSLSPEARVAHR